MQAAVHRITAYTGGYTILRIALLSVIHSSCFVFAFLRPPGTKRS